MKKYFVLFTLLFLFSAELYASLDDQASRRAKKEWPVRSQYEIAVEIDPATRSYKGHQKLIFTNRQKLSTNYVVFFVYPNDPGLTKSQTPYMRISNPKVNGRTAKIEEKGPYLRIPLGQELQKGQSITLDLDFQATLPEQKQSSDLFSEAIDELKKLMEPQKQTDTDYGLFSSGKDIVNLGLWYPMLSKYDQNGWDEEKYSGVGDVSYFDPSDFKVSITVPAEYKVVTTGSESNREVLPGSKLRYRINAPMARDFEVELSRLYSEASRIINRTRLRAFFLPQHSKSGQATLEHAAKAFEYFEKSFGRYPYTELDIVEAPLFGGAGGVEFPGLVTISSMLYQEDQQKQEDDLLKNLLSSNPV
ncbi:MAG: hypothetical protein ACRD4B_05205, partial [Acidobacteriota bacterium]